jgi:hypothetical protein
MAKKDQLIVRSHLMNWLMTVVGAESSNKTKVYGNHIYTEVIMLRANFQQWIEPLICEGCMIDPNYNFERIDKDDKRSSQTGGGRYRYFLTFYKYDSKGYDFVLPVPPAVND